MTDLLFAVPWWLPTLLAVIGFAVFINGNRSQVIKVRNIGAGVVLLAILWALVSYLVDTDKEKVEKEMRQIVQSAVEQDWKTFESLLSPTVSMSMTDRTGPAEMTNFARGSVDVVKLKSALIRNMTIDQTGALITVHCDILTTQDLAPLQTSTWEFIWQQGADKKWLLQEIHLIKLNGVEADQLRDMVRRAR